MSVKGIAISQSADLLEVEIFWCSRQGLGKKSLAIGLKKAVIHRRINCGEKKERVHISLEHHQCSGDDSRAYGGFSGTGPSQRD